MFGNKISMKFLFFLYAWLWQWETPLVKTPFSGHMIGWCEEIKTVNVSINIFEMLSWKFKYVLFCYTRERNVYIQFSSHQELTTVDQNTQGRSQVGDPILNILLFMWSEHPCTRVIVLQDIWIEVMVMVMECFLCNITV